MTPFLEIGANAGHTSYMLANDFGAEGYALDISADALRHGIALQHHGTTHERRFESQAMAANCRFAITRSGSS